MFPGHATQPHGQRQVEIVILDNNFGFVQRYFEVVELHHDL